jgi:hypothetical protein
MHTVIILATGFALLATCALGSLAIGGSAAVSKAALVFLPLWLFGARVNMYLGVKRGYSVTDELPFFLLVFGVPAAAALLLWWKLR